MYTMTDVKPVENFEKMTKDRNFYLYWDPKWPPKIGPLRPIFSTHLKVLVMNMWSNTDVTPVKNFWESEQCQDLLWGSHNVPVSQVTWSHIENFLRQDRRWNAEQPSATLDP